MIPTLQARLPLRSALLVPSESRLCLLCKPLREWTDGISQKERPSRSGEQEALEWPWWASWGRARLIPGFPRIVFQAPRAETPVIEGQRQGYEKAPSSPTSSSSKAWAGSLILSEIMKHGAHCIRGTHKIKNSFMGAWRNQILPSLYLGNLERGRRCQGSLGSWAYTQNPNPEEKKNSSFWLLLLLRLWPLQILSSYTPGGEDPVHVRSHLRKHDEEQCSLQNITVWGDNHRLAFLERGRFPPQTSLKPVSPTRKRKTLR